MQVTGVLLILAGFLTKCAAVLSSIPDAVIGGLLAMGISMILGAAMGTLQNVDLRLTRNLTVMGTAILLGALIPYHFEKNRVDTDGRISELVSGIKALDDCLNMLLSIQMLIAGVIAFALDNTVPGATREQRGFVPKELTKNVTVEDDGYALPEIVRKFLLRYPILCKLPFIPSKRSLLTSGGSCSTASASMSP